MSLKVMAVNAGSSSVKFKLYQMPEELVVSSGIVERVGKEDGIFKINYNGQTDKVILPIKDHAYAVEVILNALIEKKIIKSLDEINAIGHRVVQGGKYFNDSVVFNEDTVAKVTKLINLAPLHNKPNLIGLNAFKKVLPNVPNVAVFDTAFHQSMEEQDYLFPIPYEYYLKHDIRRYGAHGTSHLYLTEEAKKLQPNIKNQRVVTCHIGSGASISAVKNGKCVATSMGLTPLGGIMMGTRTGDIDPSVLMYACKVENKDVFEMTEIFNRESGLAGVSGISNDMRDIEDAIAKGDKRAIITEKLFVRRTADFVAQYIARLGGADLIVFSAGIGENVPYFRKEVIDEIKGAFELEIDDAKNEEFNRKIGIISSNKSKIAIAVIPTDEEIVIARDCLRILNLN